MSGRWKELPGAAEISSGRTVPVQKSGPEHSPGWHLSLCNIVLWVRMGELSLRADRWHRHCALGRPEECA